MNFITMEQYRRSWAKELKAFRDQFNWEVEEKFIHQLYSRILDWEGSISKDHFKDIFRQLRRDEVDWLLRLDATRGFPHWSLIECASEINYKDKPDLDEDGKPPQRRTTAVHLIARLESITRFQPGRFLFDIYDRFDVNYADELGFTHFHAACVFNRVNAARQFLELGQDPNLIVPRTLDAPLHLTTSQKVVRLLLEKGADPNLANAKGSTPLHNMCQLRIDSKMLMEKFFEINEQVGRHRVRINAQDKSGDGPLHMAVVHSQMGAMEVLLANGADPNQRHGKDRATPLHFICQNFIDGKYLRQNSNPRGKISMAELLLRADADPNAKLKGSTPLHIICQRHHDRELLEKIFELGKERVNVDALDSLGRTPLFYAVVTLGPSLVDALLDNHADLENFTFPTFDDFDKNSEPWIRNINYKLILASGVMTILDSLEKRGYEWCEKEENILTVGKLFAKYGLFQPSSDSDLRLWRGKCWFEEEAFVEKAKTIQFKADLSLHEVIQLRPKVAEKKLDYLDYFAFARSSDLCDLDKRNSCAVHLCEKLARTHFHELALEAFSRLFRVYNLPPLVCEMIFDHLTNKDLWHIYGAWQQQVEIDRQNNASS